MSQPEVQLSKELLPSSLIQNYWMAECHNQGFPFYMDAKWPTQIKEAPEESDDLKLERILYKHVGIDVFGRFRETLFHLEWESGKVDVSTGGTTKKVCSETIDYLKTVYPTPSSAGEDLPISIWHAGAYNQGDSIERVLKMPSWEQIRGNYTADVVSDLDRLMSWRDFPLSGKLMLWLGERGTGKSHALRAIAREWSDWCHSHYIADPERFLTDTGYLLNVILGTNNEEGEDGQNDKARLLITEDAGELITASSKAQLGQAVGRLLNLSDGILGQGSRSLILITTNEEQGKLNEAVTRPGRCAPPIVFGALSEPEAQEWARQNDISLPLGRKSWVLSDLYSIKNKNILPRPRERKIGF